MYKIQNTKIMQTSVMKGRNLDGRFFIHNGLSLFCVRVWCEHCWDSETLSDTFINLKKYTMNMWDG